MLGKYKNLIIIIVIAGIGFVAYSIFKPVPDVDSGISITNSQDANILGAEITAAINQIGSLKLEKKVLEDPILKNLEDFSEPIIEQPVGRRNPFSPLGQGDEGFIFDEETSTSENNSSTTTAETN